MALKFGGRAKTLTITTPSVNTTSLQNFEYQEQMETADFLDGDAWVKSHYQGTVTATLSVEVTDLAVWAALRPGMKCTSVVLTFSAAKDTAGTGVGTDGTITLGTCVVTEQGGLSHGNEDAKPAVPKITLTLSRFPGASGDPTYTVA